MTVVLNINGRAHAVEAAPQTPLLLVLRNDLGLWGAKVGCGLEQCGSCTVIVDGAARMSCKLPIASLTESAITTIEGIGTRAAPHALQRAFMAENAAQCGYCTAGILMAAKALLDRNPHPSAAEIREALRDNLCRCGTHNRVVRAVQRAAGEQRGAATRAHPPPEPGQGPELCCQRPTTTADIAELEGKPQARRLDPNRRSRHDHGAHRQGRARPGHHHGGRADRGRGARRRRRAHSRGDRRQRTPAHRVHDGRQHVDRDQRLGRAPSRGRGATSAAHARCRAARRNTRRAHGRRRQRARARRQCARQLLGADGRS